jgi:DNA-binding NarL/FixJ family response regulator
VDTATARSMMVGEPEQRPIRVVIAEDSYLIREVLTTALSGSDAVELVAICSNGKELRTAIDNWHPDVVMTDIRMPPSRADEGIRVAVDLRETAPETGVVVLSQYAEPSYALALLEKGTGGRAYLLKERISNKEELIGAIQAVARGGSVIDPMIVDVLIDARSRAANSRLSHLTPREREQLGDRRIAVPDEARCRKAHQLDLLQARSSRNRGCEPASEGDADLPRRGGRRCPVLSGP